MGFIFPQCDWLLSILEGDRFSWMLCSYGFPWPLDVLGQEEEYELDGVVCFVCGSLSKEQ